MKRLTYFWTKKRNLIANVELDKICEIYFLIDGAISQVHNQQGLQSKLKTISFVRIAEVFFRMVFRLQNNIFPGIRKTKLKETMNKQTKSDECCLLMSFSFKCAL